MIFAMNWIGILLTVLAAATVIGVVLAVAVLLNGAGGDAGKESAWGILQRRYTREETSDKDFEEAKKHNPHTGSCCG